jgi:hypothetical protein
MKHSAQTLFRSSSGQKNGSWFQMYWAMGSILVAVSSRHNTCHGLFLASTATISTPPVRRHINILPKRFCYRCLVRHRPTMLSCNKNLH